MVDYVNSTQKERWLFTQDRLLELRTQNRDKSIAAIEKIRTERASKARNGSQNGQEEGATPISLEEEAVLCKFYQSKIQEACRSLRFPHCVQATALTYFKRFYLQYSTLEQHPKDVMLTCIYLACKIEESYIGAEEFGRIVKQKPKILLELEFPLLQALNFDLITYAPYRPLDGYFQDLEECRSSGAGDVDAALLECPQEALDKARAAAQSSADLLMLSDAPLMFPPGQLALAAMRSGFKKVKLRLDSYLKRVALMASGAEGVEEGERVKRLIDALTQVDGYGMQAAQEVTKDEVTIIDRKLKSFNSPLTDMSAKESRRSETKDEERSKKREQKVKARQAQAAARSAEVLGDTIGPAK